VSSIVAMLNAIRDDRCWPIPAMHLIKVVSNYT